MGLRTVFRVLFDFEFSDDGDYLGVLRSGFANPDLLLANGATAGKANVPYSDVGVTLADGATRNLDLRNLTGPKGGALLFAEVRLLAIRCRDGALTFAKGASNGWTGLGSSWTIKLPSGSWTYLVCPTDGVLSTGAADRVIDITNNSGGTVTYDLVVVGTAT